MSIFVRLYNLLLNNFCSIKLMQKYVIVKQENTMLSFSKSDSIYWFYQIDSVIM